MIDFRLLVGYFSSLDINLFFLNYLNSKDNLNSADT